MAQRSTAPRVTTGYECDHLRPKVRVDGVWRHVLPSGDVGEPCIAGTYKVTATYVGEHYTSALVLDEPKEADDAEVPAELRWRAGQVASCNRDALPIRHTVGGVHVVVRCSCGCAFQSTDASLAFGMYKSHATRCAR
jgi:hypothetical protein